MPLCMLSGCITLFESADVRLKSELSGKMGCSVEKITVDNESRKNYGGLLNRHFHSVFDAYCGKKRFVCSQRTVNGLITSSRYQSVEYSCTPAI